MAKKLSTKPKPITVKIKKLKADAIIPTKMARDIADAAWDFYANESKRIPGLGKAAISTGISIAIPDGYFGNIRNRSGQAMNTPMMVDAGIIDPGYRGEIKIIMVNHGEYPYDIIKGTKIAQMLIQKIELVEMTEVDSLDTTDRNDKGFGSTDGL